MMNVFTSSSTLTWNIPTKFRLCVWEQRCEWGLQVPGSGCHPERVDCRYSIISSWIIPTTFPRGVRNSFCLWSFRRILFSQFVLALTLPRPELSAHCVKSSPSTPWKWGDAPACSAAQQDSFSPQGKHCSYCFSSEVKAPLKTLSWFGKGEIWNNTRKCFKKQHLSNRIENVIDSSGSIYLGNKIIFHIGNILTTFQPLFSYTLTSYHDSFHYCFQNTC